MRRSSHQQLSASANMLLSLLTAPALLGFASTPGGVADAVDGGCTDTSNVVMSGITGGKTCADLAAEGRCASTDDLVKTVMEKNCMASCGACGGAPQRSSYSTYATSDGADGNWVLKEWVDGAAIMERSRSNEAYAPPLLGTAGCCARGCGTFFFSKPQHLAHQQQSTPPMVPPTMAATMST